MSIKIELSLEELNIVLAGLGELPAKVSLGVIEKVRNQATPQVQAASNAAALDEVPVVQ